MTNRGPRLVAGERKVKIHGELVPVRAEVRPLEGCSGHANRQELMGWLPSIRKPPGPTFVVHGEPDASDRLRADIQKPRD